MNFIDRKVYKWCGLIFPMAQDELEEHDSIVFYSPKNKEEKSNFTDDKIKIELLSSIERTLKEIRNTLIKFTDDKKEK